MVLPWCYGLPPGVIPRWSSLPLWARPSTRTYRRLRVPRRPGAPQTPGFLAVTISEENMWRM